jgi:DNA polymerase III delta prime subunit
VPFFSGFNVIIVDEIDMVHMSAQHRFREAMQDLGNTTQFIYTTNNFKDVYTGIRDACRTVEFPLPIAAQWLPRAQYILTAEGVNLSDAKVLNILAQSNCSVRDTCRVP